MISRTEYVDRTNKALGDLYQILAGLYEEKAKYSRGYPIIAEAWVTEIFKLRKEIDDLIGLTDYVAEFGVPQTNEELDAMGPPTANGAAAPDHHPAAK